MPKKTNELAYDDAVKQFLADRQILAHILKGAVPEYKDCTVSQIEDLIEPEIGISVIPVDQTNLSLEECAATSSHDRPGHITGISNESFSDENGKIYYDIRFHAALPNTDGKITMMINLEAQNSFDPGYPIISRAEYYGARMISSQKGTVFEGSDYGKIKKVYSIFICTDCPSKWQNTISMYSMEETQLYPPFPLMKTDRIIYDLLSLIIIRLGPVESEQDNALLKLLNAFLATNADEMTTQEKISLLDAYEIRRSDDLTRRVNFMCNLGEGIRERSEAKGRAEGRAEGEAEGMILGSVKILLSMGETPDQIAERLNMTADNVKAAICKLSEQE